MNVGPEAEQPRFGQEILESVKGSEQRPPNVPEGTVEVRLPKEVIQRIERDVEEYRAHRFYEAAMEQMGPSNTLVWNPDDPLPPEHSTAPQPQMVMSGADKYHGEVAAGYDAKREQSQKWKDEQRIVEDMLSDLPPGTAVLDCPVGTGRFLRFYEERGFNAVCVDKSEDMLPQAIAKGSLLKNEYAIGNILNLGKMHVIGKDKPQKLEDNSVDVSVMVRLTRWLEPDECRQAMAELKRVTKSRIIFTARVRNHPYARPYELFTGDGWRIERDEPAGDEDHRVIMMERE